MCIQPFVCLTKLMSECIYQLIRCYFVNPDKLYIFPSLTSDNTWFVATGETITCRQYIHQL